MNKNLIGVFDSGLGGTSTLRQLKKRLPRENYFYYGDCGNAPYGPRAQEDIRQLTLSAGRLIEAAGAKALLVACNTATAAALPLLERELSIPVTGIRPAIVSASAKPGDGRILMLATEATTKLPAYRALHASLACPERVIDVPSPADIVRSVEHGVRDQAHYLPFLASSLRKYEGMKVDAIVLGCTHYPFVEGAVRAYAAEHFTGDCEIFEGGAEACDALIHVLAEKDLFSPDGSGEVEFHSSGEEALQKERFFTLLNAL